MGAFVGFDSSGQRVRLGLIARALVGDIGPAEVIDIVVSQGMAGMGASGAHASVVQDDYLHPIAALGISADSLHRLGAMTLDRELPSCTAARTGESVWLADRNELLTRFPELAAASPGAQAWAALPLVAGGKAFGSLGLSFEREMPFGEDEREWLGLLTDVAALALSRWCVVPSGGISGASTDPVMVELDSLLSIARLEGVAVIDAYGRIVKVNERLCSLFHYRPSDLLGKPVEALVPIEDRVGHISSRDRYLVEPGPRPMGGGAALRGQRSDGSTFPIDVSLSPCATSVGLHVLAVVRDETPIADAAG